MSLHCCYAASPCTSPPLLCHYFALLRPTAAHSCVYCSDQLLLSRTRRCNQPRLLLQSNVLTTLIRCTHHCNIVHSAAKLFTLLQCSPLCSVVLAAAICCDAVHFVATLSTPLKRYSRRSNATHSANLLHQLHCCALRPAVPSRPESVHWRTYHPLLCC